MSKTYAIGDLHGRLDVLEAALAKIEQHRRFNGDETGFGTTIVFLGDYIDRGPHSKGVLDRLMKGPDREAGDQTLWVCLMGNHESMCLQAHDSPMRYWDWWKENGGDATLLSFNTPRLPEEYLTWMRNLPASYGDDHRLFVHAGVKSDTLLEHHTDYELMWVRHPKLQETPHERYVVHGHTPQIDGPHVLESRVNLDCRAYTTGMAPIAVFDDEVPGKPVSMLDVRLGYTGFR